LARAKKSTSVFLGLASVLTALKEPGVAALPVPMHLRNVPTEMIDMERMEDSNSGSEQEVSLFDLILLLIILHFHIETNSTSTVSTWFS
jgi:hypothetical protein